MGAFIKGVAVLLGLLIIANIVGMLTRPDTATVPAFESVAVESGQCRAWSPIVERWEDGSARRADGCIIDAETGEVRAPRLVSVDAETADAALWDALRSQGYTGVQGDGHERLYVPAWTVVDVPGGTWTMTPDTGPRKCEDGATAECTGTEFLPGGTGR